MYPSSSVAVCRANRFSRWGSAAGVKCGQAMRNPHAGYTVTTLHDHRSGLTSHSKKGNSTFAEWPHQSSGHRSAETAAGQPRGLKTLGNMCDGSPSHISSNTLTQESASSKHDGVLDDGSAGLAGARGHKGSKLAFRGGHGRNVREHVSRERRNGEQHHGPNGYRTQNTTTTQTIQAAVVQYPIEQSFVSSPSRQCCDLMEFIEKVLNRLHLSLVAAWILPCDSPMLFVNTSSTPTYVRVCSLLHVILWQ